MTERTWLFGRLLARFDMARRHALMRSFAGVGGLTAVELVLGLATAILLARALGVEGLGAYSLALAAVLLASILVEFGLPNLVMREIAHRDNATEGGAVKGVLIFAVTVIAVMSAVIIALMLAIGGVVVPEIGSGGSAMLPVAVGLIPLSSLGKTVGAALAGKQMVVTGLISQRLVRPGVFVIALGAAMLLAPGWLTPVRAMALQLMAAAVALGFGGFLFMRHFAVDLRHGTASITWRAWTVAMLRLGVSTGIHMGQGQILLLMTGALSSVENVGLLRIAQRGAGLVALGSAIVVAVASPKIAQLSAEGRHERLQHFLKLIARAGATFALLATVGFVFAGNWLVETLFGVEFVAALGALIILAATETACALFGPSAVVLNMLRREGDTANGFLISLVITTLAGALLIPSFGEIGAAYATLAGLLSMSVFLWQRSRRTVDLDPSVFNLPIRRNGADGM